MAREPSAVLMPQEVSRESMEMGEQGEFPLEQLLREVSAELVGQEQQGWREPLRAALKREGYPWRSELLRRWAWVEASREEA